jgi:Ankyrin repeats (3 copies)
MNMNSRNNTPETGDAMQRSRERLHEVAPAPPMSRLFKLALLSGVEPAVEAFIARGEDLNSRDGNGLTPLMISAVRNKPRLCKLLLDAGADLSAVDRDGNDAIALAAIHGASEAADLLFGAGNRSASRVSSANGRDTNVPVQIGLRAIVDFGSTGTDLFPTDRGD